MNDQQETIRSILEAVRHVADADLISVLARSGPDELRVLGATGPLASEEVERYRVDLRERPALARAVAAEGPTLLSDHDEAEQEEDTYSEVLTLPGDHSCLVAPLHAEGASLGAMTLDSATCDAFSPDQINAIGAFAGLAARTIREEERADSLRREVESLAAELASRGRETALVGAAPAWQRALEELRLVAPTPANVLLTGETGTGKEQAARALHELSSRAAGPFIALNCSALVPDLALSELFGHERGAFTGAERRRLGRFELARGGTLFLDEVGELPLQAQAQLLRVIQERRFERVGGMNTVEADVRLIAATHRDLASEVAAGRFREDLLFRLAAFPIRLPPLRERPGDVALLADHLLRRVRKRLAMPELELSGTALQALEGRAWPGNVRELHNVLERAAILARGRGIHVRHLEEPQPEALAGVQPSAPPAGYRLPPDLRRLDRALASEIFAALNESAGKVSGPGGAAELLGVPPTTLHSTIGRLRLRAR